MSDREDKKLNLGDELADVKSLIAGAEDGGFSLDDILAEYGVKSPPGRSAIPLRPSSPEDDGPDLPWPEKIAMARAMDQWMKEKNHTSSLLGLGISALCLAILGPDRFIIPSMAAIVAVLTLLRGSLEKKGGEIQ